MNYLKQYCNLIKKYGSLNLPVDGNYYEKHHKMPKSLGGTDDLDNLIYLTARCHALAHQLLVKVFPGLQMKLAYDIMTMKDGKRISNIENTKHKGGESLPWAEVRSEEVEEAA